MRIENLLDFIKLFYNKINNMYLVNLGTINSKPCPLKDASLETIMKIKMPLIEGIVVEDNNLYIKYNEAIVIGETRI